MRRTGRYPRSRTLMVAVLATTLAATGLVAGAPVTAGAQQPGGENLWLTERSVANIAHAGGIHEAPQNTLFAFKTAGDRGADVLEIDLQITADGHIVAMHDSTVDRTTDGQGCAVSHTLTEIQQLDAADTHVPGQGPVDDLDPSAYPYRGIATDDAPVPDGFAASDFTVPTLEEIFQALPDALMNVEIKPQEVEGGHDCPTALEAITEAERPDIAVELARLIDEHGMADQVLVASFIDDLLHEFTAAAPDVDTSFPLGEGAALYQAFQTNQPAPNPHGHEVIQTSVQILGIEITQEVVEYARANGIAFHFWTINDPAEMNMLLDWGADGIITDRPQVLAQVLADREDPDDPPPPDGDPDPTWQSPFLCTTEFQGLGQPIVDNQEQRGTPVYPTLPDGTPDRAQAPIGWSEGCQVEPVVEYRYRTTGGDLVTLPADATELPGDIASLDVNDLVAAGAMDLEDGTGEIPYLIRYQRGTLPENRFLYSIAMLVPFDEVTSGAGADGEWSLAHWNGRLVFSFGGGVGIGHSQGELSTGDGFLDEAMRLGHAVIYTSGTRTSTHYNLMLGGRTAVEAKGLFVGEHGEPQYTVGIGGSGGGIQQYVYAQNHPELLDALIPQYSYPDMSTQTIHVGDCELLEHYMDVIDADNPRWDDWDNRKLLEGLNSIEGFPQDWLAPVDPSGSSECIEGWRGATPLAMNPTFGFTPGMDDVVPLYLGEILVGESPADFPDLGRMLRIHEDPSQWVEWTHWADVREVYGTDPATGLAEVPWDNVGVQYGLRAVADGSLTPEEFLDLNARVGSWNEPEEAVLESCALAAGIGGTDLAALAGAIGMCEGQEPDWFSARQMTFSTDPNVVAPRRSADIDAIRGAFESGLVFNGTLPREIPIIDARHYLENELDMHNSHQSFAVRERIRQAQGHVDNHAIWFLDARPEVNEEATSQLFEDGFRVMERWVRRIQRTGDVAGSRPAKAADTCWETDGTRIARGDDVWNGAVELIESGAGADGSVPEEIDGVEVGDCAGAFPLHSTSRIVAGGPVTGDVYKCHTKPVAQAITDGTYDEWDPSAAEQARLEAIFPNGVCDYSQPSVGNPSAPAYVARFSEEMCGVLDHFVELFGFDDVQEMIRNGVRGFGGVADEGNASPISPGPANDGACEVTVTWPDDQLPRVAEIAAAWGVSTDQLAHLGGVILPVLVYLAALAQQQPAASP